MHTNKLGRVYKKGQRTNIEKRLEVTDLYAAGFSLGEVSAKTGISASGCSKIVKSFTETGTLERTLKKTTTPTKLTQEVSAFIELEKTKKPSIYSREIRSKLLETGVCTNDNLPSVTLINKHIRCNLDMNRKVLQVQPKEQQTAVYEDKVDAFLASVILYSPQKLHFFDEASVVRTAGNRRYGHSFRGTPAVEIQRYASNCTYTVNLCCGYFGVDMFDIIEGASNALEMLNFFDELLHETNDMGNPVIADGDCIILDNCGFHHHRAGERMLRNMLSRKNVSLLFQPPYSPEYNVCEYVFRLMRDGLRKNDILTYEFTDYAVARAISSIPDFTLSSLYRHCGYI
jgi:transposase